MNTQQQPEATTRLFARVLGPYLVLASATALARGKEIRAAVARSTGNEMWAWAIGAFVLLLGIVVVALHPYWRGAAAVAVSLLGWATALKGLSLMAFPSAYLSWAGAVAGGPFWLASLVVMGLVGLWLAYVGWAPHKADQGHEAAPTQKPSHISRAA
ncbi:MAG: hypothetical protein ACRC20_05765 [Segniliparus sp.]|uniref:hypothetical protein n=1 Tax=Segniliparus sp. TaxID=2804064 RepID=UPI003F3B5963